MVVSVKLLANRKAQVFFSLLKIEKGRASWDKGTVTERRQS